MPKPDTDDIEYMEAPNQDDSDIEAAPSGKKLADALTWVGSGDSVAEDGVL